MTHVLAADTRNATAGASAYIRDSKASDSDDLTSIDRCLAYLHDTGRHRSSESRVVGTSFICRGSHSRQKVWQMVDQASRTKKGEYSKRGGAKTTGRPRLAIFADGTLPRDISETQKVQLAVKFAKILVDRYGCAVEIALHQKEGVIDHAHWLISTRLVDEHGVGPIIRDFNGIASRCSNEGVIDGQRVAAFPEFCRSSFADLLSQATGFDYDSRSFRRQGRDEAPTPWLPRKEYQQRAAERRRQETTTTITTSVRSARSLTDRDDARSDIQIRAAARVLDSRRLAVLKRRPLLALAAAGQILRAVKMPPNPSDKVLGAYSLDHEEIAERIRKQVDDELRLDREAFAAEQAFLDKQRGTRLVQPSWTWTNDSGNQQPALYKERKRAPDLNLNKIVDQIQAVLKPLSSSQSLYDNPPLEKFLGFEEEADEENKRKKRRQRFDLKDAEPQFPERQSLINRQSSTLKSIVSKSHMNQESILNRERGLRQAKGSSSTRGITEESSEISPILLRRAAISAATLRLRVPSDCLEDNEIAELGMISLAVLKAEVLINLRALGECKHHQNLKMRLREDVKAGGNVRLLRLAKATARIPYKNKAKTLRVSELTKPSRSTLK